MPSLRGSLLRFLVKYRHLLSFQLKRSTIDWSTSIKGLRNEAEKNYNILKMPPQIETVKVEISGLSAEWLYPSHARKDKVILYLHGGGYILGSCQAYRKIVARFAADSEIAALSLDYRLAPEHPFPAAIEDSLTAYRWLLDEGVSSSNIILAGDSAGGGLCLATLIALRDKGLPLPAAAVTISPWTDLMNTAKSITTKAKEDYLNTPETLTVFSSYYAGENSPALPLISPLYGELQGLPPLLIYVGTEEILLDDSRRFAQKAEEAGVDVTLKVWEGMFHCFPTLAPLFPEAQQAMDEMCTFIKKHINK